jgi:hypothetical protein
LNILVDLVTINSLDTTTVLDFITRQKFEDLNRLYQEYLKDLPLDGKLEYLEKYDIYYHETRKCLIRWANEHATGEPLEWVAVRRQLYLLLKISAPTEDGYMGLSNPAGCIPVFCTSFFKDWSRLWHKDTGCAFFEVSRSIIFFSTIINCGSWRIGQTLHIFATSRTSQSIDSKFCDASGLLLSSLAAHLPRIVESTWTIV